MKENIGKRLKNSQGITLVALVVTIIVLLILAGVALSSVLSQDGIFNRAEQAVDKHGEAKARETLELALGEAQMQKYEEGLTDEQLTDKINTIGEELPKEKPEHPELQNVIVDGHIFEIDRSVPKIVDYIGPANGVIITAQITQNGDWKNPVATVTGTIITYSGGSITSSTATVVSGNANVTGFPTNGGSYTISNIVEDTEIKITAKDSNNKETEKTISVVIKREKIPPIVDSVTASAVGMKIIFSATGTDNESGIKQFNYTISPTDGIPADKVEGIFITGQVVEITSTVETTYTILVTATDNCENVSTAKTAEITTIDEITIAEAKELINAATYPDYIGTKVIDYNPTAGGVWRVFYYDADNYFKDGKGTIYLKRDYDSTKTSNTYDGSNPSDGGTMLRQQNPLWSDGIGGDAINMPNELCAARFCDPEVWKDYKTTDAKYAIGAPSIEMWTKAYNVYVEKYEPSDIRGNCTIVDKYGYDWNHSEYSGDKKSISIDKQISKSKVLANSDRQWLSSPGYNGSYNLHYVNYSEICLVGAGNASYYCPVVALNH